MTQVDPTSAIDPSAQANQQLVEGPGGGPSQPAPTPLENPSGLTTPANKYYNPTVGQDGNPDAGTAIIGPDNALHHLALVLGMMAGDRYDTSGFYKPAQQTPLDTDQTTQMTVNDAQDQQAKALQNAQMLQSAAGTGTQTFQPGQSATGAGLAGRVLDAARSMFGIPYQYGANGPSSYDCSSFVQHVYAQVGITLPRVTYDQVNVGQVLNDQSQLLPGDLLFFWGDGNRRNGHVGIYVGNNVMIDEPHTGSSVGYRNVNWSQVTAMRRVLP